MGVENRPRIGIAYPQDSGNPVKHQLFDRLRSWAEIRLLDPKRHHPELPEFGLDLYHMARWSSAAYADFELANKAGIPTINSYHGARITEDRVRSARVCVEHGLPFIEYEYGTVDEITLEPPVLIKPRHEVGNGGHNFRLVYSGEILFEGKRMVERYIVPNRAFKIFNVGKHVRTTELCSQSEQWEEVDTSLRFAELAEDVAALFDLTLFELDIVVHKTYYIVDINPVVSLEGVDDALKLYETLIRTACANAGRSLC